MGREGETPNLTGPEALDIETGAGLQGRSLRIVTEEESITRLKAAGKPEEFARQWATTDYGVARGEFGKVDPVLGKLLGTPPRTFEEVLAEQAGRASESTARSDRDHPRPTQEPILTGRPMDNKINPHISDTIALQLWTIRDAMARDADHALRRVKSAGFSAVEVAPLPPGLTTARLAESLARHDLIVVSIHGDLPTPANIAQWVQISRECRCSKIIWHGWPRDPRFDSLAGVRDLISACNEAGNIARDQGLQFGMHNHWWEFELLEGERPIRLLHETLRPDIFWQLDVYWAQTAGVDPADVLSELMPRVGSIHWKDGPAVHGEPMTALGRGKVDVPRIARALTHPVDWVIELDDCATDPLEAAQQSLAYLDAFKTAAAEPRSPDVES